MEEKCYFCKEFPAQAQNELCAACEENNKKLEESDRRLAFQLEEWMLEQVMKNEGLRETKPGKEKK